MSYRPSVVRMYNASTTASVLLSTQISAIVAVGMLAGAMCIGLIALNSFYRCPRVQPVVSAPQIPYAEELAADHLASSAMGQPEDSRSDIPLATIAQSPDETQLSL